VGGADRDAAKLVAALFAPTGAPAVVTDAPTAELTKYAANAFLATKISFINSIAELCETLGADIEHLVHGLGLDPRITSLFLRPGPGWGGPCLPKDVAALLALSSDAGVDLPVVRGAVIANEQTIRHITNTIASLAGGSLMGARLGVWGLTFKAGTGDRRDSPALTVASALVAGGANVNAFDPTVPAGSTDADLAGLVACESALAAARGCDVVVVLTEWPAFAALDLTEVAAAMSTPVIYDTRGIIDERAARDAGLSLVRLGRS
jgi:UDPglucose 6-dehydrogenase